MKQAILRTVHAQPGIHFRQLQREAGCSVNTLNHHLYREDAITEAQIRGYRRCYPADIPERLHSSLAALNHEPRGTILYAVDEQSGITNTELGGVLDLAASTLSSHIHVLSDADLITIDKNGRRKQYHPEQVVSQVIAEYAEAVIDRATDNFIDLWK